KALEVARRWLERTGNGLAAFNCAFDLYLRTEFTQALHCLDQRRQTDVSGDMMRAFILAELPDGARLALQEYDNMTRKYPDEETRYFMLILLLLGKKDQACKAFQKCRLRAEHLSQSEREFAEALLEFDCGMLSEEKLLAKTGTSRFKQIRALFDIGLF